MHRHIRSHARPPRVLQLDINGVPQDWISIQAAATHYATGEVVWADGESPLAILRGGHSALTGLQSIIEVHPIVALRGAARINLFDVQPVLAREKLLRRDRCTCAYCGECFAEAELTLEHIVPQARGGKSTWMNLVAACQPCNSRKADRTPEQAGMPLLYLPYAPSRFEDFLLQGREIRADVHAWLRARLPKGSRLN